ncbi:MAG: SDR family oxidoreductase [Deltaproteobacteria bacterium]|nr:SDR family oxidoreductase [Deltaproteobacteria bacterium]
MSSANHAFVTGGTGLIGRAVVERLLQRGVNVTLMLRAGAEDRRKTELEALGAIAGGANGSLTQVTGDLSEPDLGLSQDASAALSSAGHCFHTRHLLSALSRARFDGRLHHVSSVAVAGDYADTFTEAMFQEGQDLPHAYHRSKFESEKLVRESKVDYRIYRPSSVVGDSKTGAMDRIDGVYYSFGAIKKLAYALPGWVRLPVPRIRGRFNLVPVDYVADALVHIAFSDTDARVFHLVDPKPPPFVKMADMFVAAAGGPRLGPAVDIAKMPGAKKTGALVSMLPSIRELRDAFVSDLGLPTQSLGAMNIKVRLEDANTQAALAGSDISCPPLRTYAKALYRYYEGQGRSRHGRITWHRLGHSTHGR